jgi:hypothetical protein
VLDEARAGEERLRGAAAIGELFHRGLCLHVHGQAQAGGNGFHGPHAFTSMAERRPSESRLNEIEVMKIITPGNAATQGWT